MENELVQSGNEPSEIPDISSLVIKSRLCPELNGICQLNESHSNMTNGLCDSQGEEKSDEINSGSYVQSQETSHLNQLGENLIKYLSKYPTNLFSFSILIIIFIFTDKKEATCTENRNIHIEYVSYTSELQMPDIMKLIQKDLSEPYSIYTYRYFIHNWPKLCFLVIKL